MSNEKNIKASIDPVSENSNNTILKKFYENDKDSDIYWSVQDIANYIKKSRATVYRTVLKHPKFPKPINFGKYTSKRWLAKEVKTALLKFRE